MLGQAKQLKDTSASENARFSSRDALQAYVDSFELPSKAILELGKALRISCDQLYQAKMDFASLAASAANLRKKAAEKRSAADNAAEAKRPRSRASRMIRGRMVACRPYSKLRSLKMVSAWHLAWIMRR